jgi:hypothetical protein
MGEDCRPVAHLGSDNRVHGVGRPPACLRTSAHVVSGEYPRGLRRSHTWCRTTTRDPSGEWQAGAGRVPVRFPPTGEVVPGDCPSGPGREPVRSPTDACVVSDGDPCVPDDYPCAARRTRRWCGTVTRAVHDDCGVVSGDHPRRFRRMHLGSPMTTRIPARKGATPISRSLLPREA